MGQIKSILFGAAKLALSLIVLNALLELIGGPAQNIVNRPVSTIKGLIGGGSQ